MKISHLMFARQSPQVKGIISLLEESRVFLTPPFSYLLTVGMDAFLKMMLVDNFVHADLHPGNILIDEGHQGNAPQVVLLDVGLTTQLSEKDRENFLKLFSAVVAGTES